MNDKPIYKVVSVHESPDFSKIEKSNLKVTITLSDTLQSIERNKKAMESLAAELNLKKALMSNVEAHHPKVLEVDERLKIACYTHYEASRFVALGDQKMKEFTDAQAELQKEVDEIASQTGIKISGNKAVIEKMVKEAIAKKKKK